MLAPDEAQPARWRYTLYAEGALPRDAANRIEEILRENPHYAYCRDLGQLLPLRIVRVESDAYERFVAAEMENGARAGDIKPVALSTRTDWFRRFQAGRSS